MVARLGNLYWAAICCLAAGGLLLFFLITTYERHAAWREQRQQYEKQYDELQREAADRRLQQYLRQAEAQKRELDELKAREPRWWEVAPITPPEIRLYNR